MSRRRRAPSFSVGDIRDSGFGDQCVIWRWFLYMSCLRFANIVSRDSSAFTSAFTSSLERVLCSMCRDSDARVAPYSSSSPAGNVKPWTQVDSQGLKSSMSALFEITVNPTSPYASSRAARAAAFAKFSKGTGACSIRLFEPTHRMANRAGSMNTDNGTLKPPPSFLVPLTAPGFSKTALRFDAASANSSRAKASTFALPRAYAPNPGTKGGMVAPTTTNRLTPFFIAARPGTTFVSPFASTMRSAETHGKGRAPIDVTTAVAPKVTSSQFLAFNASHRVHVTRFAQSDSAAHAGAHPLLDAHTISIFLFEDDVLASARPASNALTPVVARTNACATALPT